MDDKDKEKEIIFVKLDEEKTSILAGTSWEALETYKVFKGLVPENRIDPEGLPDCYTGEVKKVTDILRKSRGDQTYLLMNPEHDSEQEMVFYLYRNSYVIEKDDRLVEVIFDKSTYSPLRPDASLGLMLRMKDPDCRLLDRHYDVAQRWNTLKYSNSSIDKGLEAYIKEETEKFDEVIFVDYDRKRLERVSGIDRVTVVNPDIVGEENTMEHIVSLYAKAAGNAEKPE